MPKFISNDMTVHPIAGGFNFSALSLDKLGAAEYTLAAIAGDHSGSTSGFDKEIEAAFKAVAESCLSNPRADNLLLRAVGFNHEIDEIHGFKLLADVNQNDYNGRFAAGGGTALFDTIINMVESVTTFGKNLIDNKYDANGIVVVITDGCDYGSTYGINDVKNALANALKKECLESLVSILVGINVSDPHVSDELKKLAATGFTQYVEAKDANPKTLAKLAQFVSKSISAQSQSLGSGGGSKALTF